MRWYCSAQNAYKRQKRWQQKHQQLHNYLISCTDNSATYHLHVCVCVCVCMQPLRVVFSRSFFFYIGSVHCVLIWCWATCPRHQCVSYAPICALHTSTPVQHSFDRPTGQRLELRGQYMLFASIFLHAALVCQCFSSFTFCFFWFRCSCCLFVLLFNLN